MEEVRDVGVSMEKMEYREIVYQGHASTDLITVRGWTAKKPRKGFFLVLYKASHAGKVYNPISILYSRIEKNTLYDMKQIPSVRGVGEVCPACGGAGYARNPGMEFPGNWSECGRCLGDCVILKE